MGLHLILWSTGSQQPRAGFSHIGENLLLVAGIALNRFHQVGNEICPPLQLVLHLGPASFHILLQFH